MDNMLLSVAHPTTDRDKWVFLLMDEMHVKENLVFDKHTGNVNTFALLKILLFNAYKYMQKH